VSELQVMIEPQQDMEAAQRMQRDAHRQPPLELCPELVCLCVFVCVRVCAAVCVCARRW